MKLKNLFTVSLLTAALAVLPIPIAAQAGQPNQLFTLAALYDLDSTSYIYCTTTGERGFLDPPRNNQIRVTSSTTTLAATVALTSPFATVGVGDFVYVVVNGVPEERVVVARASADSLTMNAALSATMTNVQFGWRDRTCGVEAANGWFPVNPFTGVSISLMVSQIVVTGQIEFKIQCRDSGVDAQAVDVYAEGMSIYRTGGYNAAQVDNDDIIIHNGVKLFHECRVGMLIDSADDGDDLTTNGEQVTIKVKLTGSIQ